MMKEVVRALESGPLAEIGLIAFFVAFVLVVIRVLLMRKETREQAKQIPLDDGVDIVPEKNHDHAR